MNIKNWLITLLGGYTAEEIKRFMDLLSKRPNYKIRLEFIDDIKKKKDEKNG